MGGPMFEPSVMELVDLEPTIHPAMNARLVVPQPGNILPVGHHHNPRSRYGSGLPSYLSRYGGGASAPSGMVSTTASPSSGRGTPRRRMSCFDSISSLPSDEYL